MNSENPVFNNAMKSGHSAAWDQQWEQAAENYRVALKEIPDHPAALANLGLVLYETRQFDEALQCYQRLAQISPQDGLAQERIGRIKEKQGLRVEALRAYSLAADLHLRMRDVDKAIENLLRFISLEPEHLLARSRLAMIYEKMDRKQEAVGEYLAVASIYQRMGDISHAMKSIEHCLQILPDHPAPKQALLQLRNNQLLPKPLAPRIGSGPVKLQELRKGEDEDEADKKLADPITEAMEKALSELASLMLDQGEESSKGERKGISAFTRGTGGLSLAENERRLVLLHLGQAIDYQTQGNEERAIEELNKAHAIGLHSAAAHFTIGNLLAHKNDKNCLLHLRKVTGSQDYSLASYLLMGQFHEKLHQFPLAAQNYLRALRSADLTTVSSDMVEMLYQAYEPMVDSITSSQDNERLVSLCTAISDLLIRTDWKRHILAARQGLPTIEESGFPVPLAEMILDTGTSNMLDSMARINALGNQGRMYSALEEAYQLIVQAPNYLPLHAQIAELMLRDGKTQEAVHKFLLTARLYVLRGEPAQAVRIIKRILQISPMDLETRNLMVDTLLSQGNVNEAIQQYMELAETYYQMADLDQARKTYALALKLTQHPRTDPGWKVQIMNKMADIDLQKLDLRQAALLYEQIRTQEPEDPEARFHLISIYLRLGQDMNAFNELDGYVSMLENSGKRVKAIELVKNLISEWPDKMELSRRLADLYVRDGDIQNGVSTLDGIADEMVKHGNQSGAVSMLLAIIALNPPNVAEYQHALQRVREL
ncbi:MAG TPA: tetratricopeptide repeat protein [Anaerolineaceae bacterium]|nr:tetratricopeptide repeat protein [Anaerolineaceae bacterium]